MLRTRVNGTNGEQIKEMYKRYEKVINIYIYNCKMSKLIKCKKQNKRESPQQTYKKCSQGKNEKKKGSKYKKVKDVTGNKIHNNIENETYVKQRGKTGLKT